MPEVPASADTRSNGKATDALPAAQCHRRSGRDLRHNDDAASLVICALRNESPDLREGRDDPHVYHRIAPHGGRRSELENGYRSNMDDHPIRNRRAGSRGRENDRGNDGDRAGCNRPAPLKTTFAF